MSNRRRATPSRRPNGLKAALARKTIRTTHFDIPLEPSEKVDEIGQRLRMARQALLVAPYANVEETAAEKTKRIAEAQAAVDALKAELDDCFWRLEFRGLPGDDGVDKLMNRYPPTDEQIAEAEAKGLKKGDDDFPVIDLDAFNVAYLMATLVNPDPDMTAEDWRETLWSDSWTPADRIDLFNKVHETRRPFSAGISFE